MPARQRKVWTSLLRDNAGVSAIEFALILPLMLMILVGMSEMAQAVSNWRKLTATARSIADLTAQGDATNPMAASTMNDIFSSASATLLPFRGTDAAIVVSSVAVNRSLSSTNPYVCSSAATQNASPRPVGLASDIQMPPSYAVTDGNRYILAELTMPFQPMLGGTFANLFGGSNGSIMLHRSIAWPTRGGIKYNGVTTEVTLPNGSNCP